MTSEELIAEIRDGHERQDRPEGEPPMCLACSPLDWPCDAVRAADALEARQPSVIDRDVAIDAIAGGTISVPGGYGVLHGDDAANIVDAIIGHATVPDAATEAKANAKIADLVYENASLKAERDAALAAIERVRAINTGNNRALYGNDFEAGMAKALWLVKAALDGAPEPDREVQLERVAARLREIVYLCGDDLGCQCEEAQDASADLAMELSIIAAERPTLTANEVWAIAKAEHDYANDSDNVGAFVDSLTDALRTAGVAFDEQPFIDSGYLLPVEGEKP